MSETTTNLNIASKDDAKKLVEFFIGQKATTKIEITKSGQAYKGAFTVTDPPESSQ